MALLSFSIIFPATKPFFKNLSTIQTQSCCFWNSDTQSIQLRKKPASGSGLNPQLTKFRKKNLSWVFTAKTTAKTSSGMTCFQLAEVGGGKNDWLTVGWQEGQAQAQQHPAQSIREHVKLGSSLKFERAKAPIVSAVWDRMQILLLKN